MVAEGAVVAAIVCNDASQFKLIVANTICRYMVKYLCVYVLYGSTGVFMNMHIHVYACDYVRWVRTCVL